jgi:hypothetical protein
MTVGDGSLAVLMVKPQAERASALVASHAIFRSSPGWHKAREGVAKEKHGVSRGSGEPGLPVSDCSISIRADDFRELM